LADDPVANYLNSNEKGSIVTGKVIEVEAKSAVIELAENVHGTLRAAEIAVEKVEDARTRLNVGDMIEAKITGTDRKTHTITLSMKSKDAVAAPKKAAKAATGAAAPKKKEKSDGTLKTTLGDLFKEKMGNQDSEK
jgi:small subunit ribosomal protein S1